MRSSPMMIQDIPRSPPFAYRLVLISFLLLTFRAGNAEDSECDYILSDSYKDGKVVHTFQTSCYEGEILWRYPFGGLELTFRKPASPRYAMASPRLDERTERDDEGLQFCYVVAKRMTNVTMLREMPGSNFLSCYEESCFDISTSDPVKFYIESIPSQHSSLVGKFQLHYVWSKRTPFEQCRRCRPSELNAAVCTAGNIFTGHVERPFKERTIAVSVGDILRLDSVNLPEGSCIQGNGKSSFPRPSRSTRQWRLRGTPSKHIKCDEIVMPDARKCSYEIFPSIRNRDDEFIFVADTVLRRFRPRCVMPVKKFWKTWQKLEESMETDCLL